MERTILKGPDFYAVVEDGRLAEYIPADRTEQSGDILLGKVDRMMPSLNSVFVNIGRKKDGFLPLAEKGNTFTDGKPVSGQTLILQVRKEETGEKGAFLTRDITLAGTYVIMMPKNRYVGVSSRIEDEAERDNLKMIGREISGGRFGLILRHTAPDIGAEGLRAEAESLYRRWRKIEAEASAGGRAGTVLMHSGPLQQLQDDYSGCTTERVDGLSAELKRQLSAAEAHKVPLSHGGNIVIDRCEAMTVIDVNTASSAASGDKERHFLETNLDACGEIAFQVRLRDIAGIIIIDFIDLASETDRSLVLEELKKYFAKDRIKTVMHGWTKLGLMEMTRKRR